MEQSILIGPERVKKLPAFYGTWRFITPFAIVRHQPLSRARSNQSTYPIQHLRYILILSSHIRTSITYQIQLGWSYPQEQLYGNLHSRDGWSVHTKFELGSLKGKQHLGDMNRRKYNINTNMNTILTYRKNTECNVGAKMKTFTVPKRDEFTDSISAYQIF
jgi:hypothetical protein